MPHIVDTVNTFVIYHHDFSCLNNLGLDFLPLFLVVSMIHIFLVFPLDTLLASPFADKADEKSHTIATAIRIPSLEIATALFQLIGRCSLLLAPEKFSLQLLCRVVLQVHTLVLSTNLVINGMTQNNVVGGIMQLCFLNLHTKGSSYR